MMRIVPKVHPLVTGKNGILDLKEVISVAFSVILFPSTDFFKDNFKGKQSQGPLASVLKCWVTSAVANAQVSELCWWKD